VSTYRICLSLCLCFNGHLSGEPGLASFIEARNVGSGGDNWSYKSCKAPVKSSLPTNVVVMCQHIVSVSLSVSVLTVIFPGEPGLASFIEARNVGSGGDNWSYKSCKAPVKSSLPTNQNPTFYRQDALPVTQPTVSKH